MKLELEQGPRGMQLPSFSHPGGLPLAYLTHDGEVLCPRCANKPKNCRRIKDCEENTISEPLLCEQCGSLIAYAWDEIESCWLA